MNARNVPVVLGGAAVALVISFSVYVSGTGGDVLARAAERPDPPALRGQRPPGVDDELMARIERLRPRLDRLAPPVEREAMALELAMFGELPLPDVELVIPAPEPEPEPEPEPVVEVVPPPPPPPPPPFDYVVSMTYVSSASRFAVIDGHMYRVGSQLPDEALVIGIEPNAVGIERPDETRWLQVQQASDVDIQTSKPAPVAPAPGAEAVAEATIRARAAAEAAREQ